MVCGISAPRYNPRTPFVIAAFIIRHSMNPYTLFARYYDLENADLTEDLPFWLELAETCGDPILELGCGTGPAACWRPACAT